MCSFTWNFSGMILISRVIRKKILNETNDHTPLQVKWSVPINLYRKMTEQFRPELFDDSGVKRDRLYK
jgi:hypothetical protein